MLTGGCFCGQVRYEVSGTPYSETDCHCSMCRRASGAQAVAWFSVKRSGFRFVAGEPTRYQSSAKAVRSFCPKCGTQLTFETESLPDELDVTICSLDDPNAVPPKDHVHTSSKLRWVQLGDGLRQYLEGHAGG